MGKRYWKKKTGKKKEVKNSFACQGFCKFAIHEAKKMLNKNRTKSNIHTYAQNIHKVHTQKHNQRERERERDGWMDGWMDGWSRSSSGVEQMEVKMV